eukprot:6176843-Pleurochrysis_carterae.AAC.3
MWPHTLQWLAQFKCPEQSTTAPASTDRRTCARISPLLNQVRSLPAAPRKKFARSMLTAPLLAATLAYRKPLALTSTLLHIPERDPSSGTWSDPIDTRTQRDRLEEAEALAQKHLRRTLASVHAFGLTSVHGFGRA